MGQKNPLNEADEQALSAYLDGELDASAAAALEQRLANEPQLMQWLTHMQVADDILPQALVDLEGEIPGHISSLLHNPPSREPMTQRFMKNSWWRPALAASLFAGVGLTIVLLSSTTSTVNLSQSTTSALSQRLEHEPSAPRWLELPNNQRLRIELSFPTNTQTHCREYILADQRQSWRGIACRRKDQWITEFIVTQPAVDTSSAYQLAGPGDAAAVDTFVVEIGGGEVLHLEQEAALIANHWR
ncbi:MAG: hypothetical protein HOC23_01005 [Halieaceae bacterium]|nr:hypothetical protein [Halieaceae bacterium]